MACAPRMYQGDCHNFKARAGEHIHGRAEAGRERTYTGSKANISRLTDSEYLVPESLLCGPGPPHISFTLIMARGGAAGARTRAHYPCAHGVHLYLSIRQLERAARQARRAPL